MCIDEDEKKRASPPTTIWIETELKRLDSERELWRGRWYALKSWLHNRRDAQTWTTLGMIEAYMDEITKDTPSRYSFSIISEGEDV